MERADPPSNLLECKQSEDTQAEVKPLGGRISSPLADQVDDQLVSVPNARAELRLSRLGACADEEQLPVPHVGQVQAVVDLGDAAGFREVLVKVWKSFKVAADFKCC